MKKLNIMGRSHIAIVSKWLEKDKVSGKPICIYKEDTDKRSQPKGFPKHFKNRKEAEKYLQQMEIFKNIADNKKKK